MPPKSKTAAKKGAHVDRYERNARRVAEGDAGAEEASVASQEEGVSEEEEEVVEALLQGGEEEEEEDDSTPPKEWTLLDGSPVFRAGKKNLRLDPRKNRRGNGEDSDEYRRAERIARGETVTPRDETPPPIVPVDIPVRPIAMRSPTMARQQRGDASRTSTPPKTKSKTQTNATAASASPIDLPKALLALLLAVLLGAGILYGLTGIGTPTVINFTGSNDNTTTLDQMIGEHAFFQSTTARITQLESKFDQLSKQLQLSIDAQSQAHTAQLKLQREELSKEITSLKESLNKALAEKIDASHLEKSIQPKLESQKAAFEKIIAALTTRVVDLESRPISVGSGGDSVPLAEITELKKQISRINTQMAELTSTASQVQALEAKLKNEIIKELSSAESQKLIVSAINHHIATGGIDAKDSIKSVVDTVLKSSKELQKSVSDLQAMTVRVQEMDAKVKSLEARPTTSTPVTTAPVDLSGVESGLKILDLRVSELATVQTTYASQTQAAKDDVARLEKALADLKAEVASIPRNSVGTPSAGVSDMKVAELQKRIDELAAKIASSNNAATNAQVMEDVRREVAKEISKRVSSGTTSVGLPDHALFSNGARPFQRGIGWDPLARTVSAHGGSQMETASSGNRLLSSLRNFLPGSPGVIKQVESVVLHPDMTPGSCWSFPGHSGNYSVLLSYPLIPNAFTIDHIPASEALVPGSMPKHFTIYGAQDVDGVRDNPNIVRLFSGEYRSDGPTAQTFTLPQVPQQAFNVFLLNIQDNYGAEYTCLYRFRVHGSKSIATPSTA
jgi:SUN domain-containing protein 1/2